MKVVQLIDTLRAGGAERMAVNMATVFSQASIDNMLIVSREAGMQADRLDSRTQLQVLHKTGSLDWKAFRKLLRLVREFSPDILHVHSTSLYWGVPLKWFLKDVKLIWHDHYGLSDQLKEGDRKIERFCSSWIDGVVSVNEKLKNWAIQDLGMQSKNVVMISNFPHLKELDRSKRLNNEKVILFQLANFRPQKNHFLAVKSLKILLDEYQLEAELWLAGSTELDQQYTVEVNQLIEDLDLSDQVQILGEVEDVEDILEKASVGLLTSDSEGLPVSLLEYGLAALPVVVTEVGQCKKVLENGKYGVLVPVNDERLFAKALKELLEDYPKAIEMGEEFHKHTLHSYGGEKFLLNYKQFVESI